MIRKHWKEVKIITYIVVAIGVFCLYLHQTITTPPIMEYNEIITLPVTGVMMPFWLFTGLGFLLMPGFTCLLASGIFEKIEIRFL